MLTLLEEPLLQVTSEKGLNRVHCCGSWRGKKMEAEMKII